MKLGVGWLLAVAVTARAGRSAGKATCSVCTSFVDKFKEGMGRTKGKSSGSGNTEWEERHGLKYSTSEARLIEVLDGACGHSDMKCLGFLEDHEEFIEEWFIGNAVDLGDMRRVLCVNEAKLCCEEGFFGAACKPCPGGGDRPCSGHGACAGSGDRKGKGKCSCDVGYIGKRCAKCGPMHFKNGNASDYSCTKCDTACAKGCTGPARADCTKCASGFEMADGGCTDVDECTVDTANCTDSATFCVNTDGSYTCERCDDACHPDDGCTGRGPKLCAEKSCADGYEFLDDTGCTDVNECNAADSPCAENTFCRNTPGSHECKVCAEACADGSGCTDETPLGCRACSEGYRVPDGRDTGCEDVNECEPDSPCTAAFSCENTPGSYQCACLAPKVEQDGACVEPEPTGIDGSSATVGKDEL